MHALLAVHSRCGLHMGICFCVSPGWCDEEKAGAQSLVSECQGDMSIHCMMYAHMRPQLGVCTGFQLAVL